MSRGKVSPDAAAGRGTGENAVRVPAEVGALMAMAPILNARIVDTRGRGCDTMAG